jgi:hypothetical protein
MRMCKYGLQNKHIRTRCKGKPAKVKSTYANELVPYRATLYRLPIVRSFPSVYCFKNKL